MKNLISKNYTFSQFLALIFISQVCFAELIEKTVAIINNDAILKTDLEKLSIRVSKEAMVDDLLMFDKTSEQLKKDANVQMDFLIDEKILDSEIKRQNLTVTSERVDQEIREIAKKNKISKEELIQAVGQQGITESDYQNFIKTRIERQSLIEQEITSKIKITDEDVISFYLSEFGKGLSQAFEYGIAHILIRKDSLPEAEAALAELKKGEKFETIVKKYSEDQSSNDGVLGAFKSGEFSKEFEDAVRSIQVGDFTSIIRSKNGFHILKLTSKKAVLDPNFESKKEQLKAQLFDKIFKKQLKNWIDQKKDESFIKFN